MSHVKIATHLDPAAILAARGLGQSDLANILMAETVARLSNPYVPMASGSGTHMKDNYVIAADGSMITYRGPYAHYQYVGEVMVGESGSPYGKSGEQKHYNGQEIQYNGAPLRGKEWDKRMMADRGDEVRKAVAKYVGGKVK